MTKAELIYDLRTSRAELDALVEGMPEEELTARTMSGAPSVKDVLAHLAAWEAELVTALAKLKQGVRSRFFDLGDEHVDALNATTYEDNKDRPLERVMADFRGVRVQVIRQVERFSQAELDAPVSKHSGATLTEVVLGETIEHQQEHLPDLRAWRVGSSPGPPGAGMVCGSGNSRRQTAVGRRETAESRRQTED